MSCTFMHIYTIHTYSSARTHTHTCLSPSQVSDSHHQTYGTQIPNVLTASPPHFSPYPGSGYSNPGCGCSNPGSRSNFDQPSNIQSPPRAADQQHTCQVSLRPNRFFFFSERSKGCCCWSNCVWSKFEWSIEWSKFDCQDVVSRRFSWQEWSNLGSLPAWWVQVYLCWWSNVCWSNSYWKHSDRCCYKFHV